MERIVRAIGDLVLLAGGMIVGAHIGVTASAEMGGFAPDWVFGVGLICVTLGALLS